MRIKAESLHNILRGGLDSQSDRGLRDMIEMLPVPVYTTDARGRQSFSDVCLSLAPICGALLGKFSSQMALRCLMKSAPWR